MVNYYTLEQAAQILRVTPEKLRDMAKRNEVRAFQDRGSLRFRAQEIDELARAKGLGSDMDLQIPADVKSGPASPRPTQVKKPSSSPDEDSDEVPIGNDPGMDRSGSRSSSRIGKPSTGGPKTGMGKSPPPKPASDSDVRLVMEGSDLDFEIKVDSGVKLSGPATPPSKTAPKSGPKSGGPKSGPKSSGPKSGPKSSGPKSPPRSAGPASPPAKTKHPPAQPDSGIRLVGRDQPSDSDVRLSSPDDEVSLGEQGATSPSDSDIRVAKDERDLPQGGKKLEHVTEEIDLDAEQAAAMKAAPPPKHRPGSSPALPTSSPFELSEPEMNLGAPAPEAPAPSGGETDSSDFELALEDSSEEFTLASDELPVLGEPPPDAGPRTTKGTSGINLDDPVDSGISLEQAGSDEIEFELSLDPGTSSSGKGKAKDKEEDSSSSSDFELSLDEDLPAATESSDSEFELNLDVEGSDDLVLEAAQSDSESEFELTLDDAGSLQVEEESGSSEAEVFETDFDVPALGEEDSGSEALALEESETDVESSDFDLALDEEPVEESGSDAVALEESEEDFEEGEEEPAYEEEAEEEEEAETVAAGAAAAPPAPWGVIPAVFLMPSVIVLFLVGLMSFELVQGMWGYHKPGKVSNLIIDPIARMFVDDKLPKD
jgi:excisionase family DNA binding protein